MIFGIVFLSKPLGIFGPAYGVMLGAILHLLIQIPLIRKINFRFFLSLDFKDTGTKEMFKLIPPRLLSVLIANTLYTVNNSLAILISNPSVVFLKFGTQLQ
jgi:putative peptidoglycan lipid II flippase